VTPSVLKTGSTALYQLRLDLAYYASTKQDDFGTISFLQF
jgi:hypothetical protein